VWQLEFGKAFDLLELSAGIRPSRLPALSPAPNCVRIWHMKLAASSVLWAVLLGFSLIFSSDQAASENDTCERGYEALRRKELTTAEELLNQCVSNSPGLLKPYLALCALYQSQNKVQELYRIALDGLQRFPQEKRFYLTVGNQAGQEKRYEQAIEVFSSGNRRWPEDAQLRNGLASSHLLYGMKLLDETKHQEAERHLRQAAELNPLDVEAHLNLGRVLHNLSRTTEALAEFDQVLKLDPKTPLARFHRGMVLLALGNPDESIAELTQEIQENPTYPPSYLFRAQALVAKAEWARALPDLEVAVQKMPDNPKAQFTLARCLNQLGKTKEAEAAFRRALELDPYNPDFFNALGRLLALSDRKQEAELMFEKARELNKKIRTASAGEIRFESTASSKYK
jgi:tetratricopeptide (TPR) repeat protein